jgi:hypothetical protein
MPAHPGLGCKGPEGIFNGAAAMKPWKTSSAIHEPRNGPPSFRLDPQWSVYGRLLPQGTSRKPETGLDLAKPPDVAKTGTGHDPAKPPCCAVRPLIPSKLPCKEFVNNGGRIDRLGQIDHVSVMGEQ